MSTVTLLIVVVVVVVVVAALAVVATVVARKRRSERLREEFGPEYERTLRESDDPDAAEADLLRREKEHRKLELRPLDDRERSAYRDRWNSVQQEFVDDPGRAVENADRLVVDVMSARGYPAEDVDRRADDLSVDYPVITQRYREARSISRSHEQGRADTEDLRNAVTSYRELVNALLDDRDSDSRGSLGDGRGAGGGAAALDAGRDGSAGRDGLGDRGRDGDRDRRDAVDRDHLVGRDGDRGRDGLGDRDGRGARDDARDRGIDHPDRARDDHDDHDGRRLRDVVRDKVTGRDAGPDRDGVADRGVDPRDDGRDRLRGDDRDRVSDDAHDDRRLRDVVRDKVSGRDDAGPDHDRRDAGPVDGPGRQPWERGRHASRNQDDPRREATT